MDTLKQRYPGSMIASIGPAGENQVRFASIQFDQNRHSFARAGMGAVMGAKKLKAIVVQPQRGGRIQVKDPQAMKIISKDINETCEKLFGADPDTMNIYSHEKKGRAVWWHENYKLILDSLGICFYLGQTFLTHGRLLPEELAKAWSTSTGIEASGASLQKAAERCVQVERAINSLQGVDRKKDSFTKRPENDSWGQDIDLDHPGMLDEYYEYRGLSKKGLPTKERLIDAGLEGVATVLDNTGSLDKLSGSNGYRNLDTIIRNPSILDIGNGAKTKIRDVIRKHMMAILGRNPMKYRKHLKESE